MSAVMWTRALMSSVSGAEGPAEVATEAGMLLPRVPSSCWKPREAAEVLAVGAAPAAAAADAEAAGAAFCEYACICWDQSKLPCIMRVSMNVRGNLNVKGTHAWACPGLIKFFEAGAAVQDNVYIHAA